MPELAQVQMFVRDLFHLNARILRGRMAEPQAVRVAAAIERAAVAEMQAIRTADEHAQSLVALTPAPR